MRAGPQQKATRGTTAFADRIETEARANDAGKNSSQMRRAPNMRS
jgi:hypothetical protein